LEAGCGSASSFKASLALIGIGLPPPERLFSMLINPDFHKSQVSGFVQEGAFHREFRSQSYDF
jgi:hypothetical protein